MSADPSRDSVSMSDFNRLTGNWLQVAILHLLNGCFWSGFMGCSSCQPFLPFCQNNFSPILGKATIKFFFDCIGGQPLFQTTMFAIQYVSCLIESLNLCWTICSFDWTRYPNPVFAIFLADFSTNFFKFNTYLIIISYRV